MTGSRMEFSRDLVIPGRERCREMTGCMTIDNSSFQLTISSMYLWNISNQVSLNTVKPKFPEILRSVASTAESAKRDIQMPTERAVGTE